jgi:hypothetical protein
VEGERIVIHQVPLQEIDSWLANRIHAGALIDPKVYTCLYLIERSGLLDAHAQ